MARLARVVAPGRPHHVTQRGNRRQPTFFGDDDYREYLVLLGDTGDTGTDTIIQLDKLDRLIRIQRIRNSGIRNSGN